MNQKKKKNSQCIKLGITFETEAQWYDTEEFNEEGEEVD